VAVKPKSGVVGDAYVLGGSNGWAGKVLWFKREHRLALLGLAPRLFEKVQGSGWFGQAALVREPDNEADPNAVLVQIDGQSVGYLPADEAARLSGWVKARNAEGLTVMCPVQFRLSMDQAELLVDLY
jgi:hypothetical protein